MNLIFKNSYPEIPNTLHFCFGMAPDFGGRPFGLSNYLSVRSAWEVLRPDVMILHCVHEPYGKWWDLASPMLIIHRVSPIKGIYGFPVTHPAHKADIIRLAALIAMGGIYADTDVLFLKSFKDLPSAPFTAAWEFSSNGKPVGLSNAILIAEAESRFAKLCLEGHDPARSLWKGFRSRGRDEHYVEYSVRYPSFLAQRCPGMVQTLSSELFLPIAWDETALKNLFEKDDTLPSEALTVHLWESHSWAQYLSRLSPEVIASKETAFNRLARRFLPDIPVTPGKEGLDMSHLEKGFERMDRICRDADFIKEDYLLGRTIADRIKKKFRKFAGQMRHELVLPLRSRMDQLERQLRDQEWSSAVPSLQAKIKKPVALSCRLGPGDGSDRMLASAISDSASGDPISYLIATGDGGEPAAAHWLALQSECQGFWISESLVRAQKLDKWAIQTGRLCTAWYCGTSMKEWLATWSAYSERLTPTVLVIVGTGREYWQWRAMENCSAKVVLVACNPAFDPAATLAVPSESIVDESGILWGASLGAMRQLGFKRGYRLRDVSVDGQFLIFARAEVSESENLASFVLPSVQSVMVRTLYGDTFEISHQEAQRILGRSELVDVSIAG